jgi:N-acetyl sugar amidotransferase
MVTGYLTAIRRVWEQFEVPAYYFKRNKLLFITFFGYPNIFTMKCNRCVLDDSVPEITYDKYGFCNYCCDYLSRKNFILKNKSDLDQLVNKITRKRSRYNCIVGISGGLDSSFLLYTAVKLGLKPLAVHVDTGWNTEIAVRNIQNLTRELNVDLKTFVLDWEQFKQLQISFLRSGVVDIEIPTDHYYLAALYKTASDLNIRYILTGNNFSSEGIMPSGWTHNKGDTLNMIDIYKKFGNKAAINKLPTLTLIKRFYYYNIKKIENIFLLNYTGYNREEAKRSLLKNTGWTEHPVKHGESIFTRFYHRYILPNRFNIDIRKAHLSAMICTNQVTRAEALRIIETDKIDLEIINEDRKYVLKKLGLTEFEFYAMMAQSVKSHFDFRSEIRIKQMYNSLLKMPFKLDYVLKISNRH